MTENDIKDLYVLFQTKVSCVTGIKCPGSTVSMHFTIHHVCSAMNKLLSKRECVVQLFPYNRARQVLNSIFCYTE